MIYPNQQRLKELFDYNPETGIFTRLKTVKSNAMAGDIAGRKGSYGYIHISIDGSSCLAHRLAWIYVHGKLPEGIIDHINGIRNDNRILNLREATDAENKRNARTPLRNTSGVKGVSWAKREKKWQVHMKLDGKTYWFGYHRDFEVAKEVARKARQSLHKKFANHGDRTDFSLREGADK